MNLSRIHFPLSIIALVITGAAGISLVGTFGNQKYENNSGSSKSTLTIESQCNPDKPIRITAGATITVCDITTGLPVTPQPSYVAIPSFGKYTQNNQPIVITFDPPVPDNHVVKISQIESQMAECSTPPTGAFSSP